MLQELHTVYEDCDELAYGSTHQPCTFVRPSTDQLEWILGPETTWLVLSQLLKILEIKTDEKILIPGIGESTIAFKLAEMGYTGVTATDIDDSAIQFQENLQNETKTKYQINPTNLLEDQNANEFVKYRLIIDKSTLDVWLRGGCSSMARVLDFYKNNLASDGVILCISMFHRYIRSRDVFAGYKTLYSSIPQLRGSRTRPLQGNRVQWAAMYVNFIDKNDSRYDKVKSETYNISVQELSLVEALKIPSFKDTLNSKRKLADLSSNDAHSYTYVDLDTATFPVKCEEASGAQ